MKTKYFTLLFLFLTAVSNPMMAQGAPNDCVNAITVFGNRNFDSDIVGNGIGVVQEILNYCAGSEHNSIWLKINVIKAGNLGFDIIPNNPDINIDYDFWVFGPNKTCGALGVPIRCSTANPNLAGFPNNITGLDGSSFTTTSGPGANGSQYLYWLDVKPGETYYIAIDRPIGIDGFALEWTTSSPNNIKIPATGFFAPAPVANTINYTICSNTPDVGVFNLDSARQLINPDSDYNNHIGNNKISFHTTTLDALNQTYPLPDIYTNISNPQTLYARVTDKITNSYNLTSLSLSVDNNCNSSTCSAPTGLKTSNIAPNSATFSWTPTGNETSWQVSINPHGTSPSDVGIVANINPFVVTGLEPDTCYSLYVRAGCNSTSSSEWAGPIDFCSVSCINNASCPGTMQLIAFVDTNDNGIKDTGEANFDNGNFVYDINNSGTPFYGYSNSASFNIYESNPANSYNLNFAVNSDLTSYYSSATTLTNITIANGNNTTYYFPIKQLQPYNDLEVYLNPTNSPRPGFNYNNYIYYKNKGVETISSGTITFTNSPKVTITHISENTATTTPTGFTYTFTNLKPNKGGLISIDMLVSTIPTISLGDLITNSATIDPVVGDAFPIDNSSSLSKTVIGSYDPNEMTESHGRNIVFDDFTAADYLYYTIKFENTGTADAEFIRVEDLLDASLDPNSMVMLNSNHTYNMRRIDNNLIWNFYNINLPTTMTSPNDSHGTIQFKIKPKAGYKVGDIIPNKANIYFDYNPAIETNEFQTEFTQNLKNTTFDSGNFVLYPNPTNTSLQINSQINETIKSIVVYDILGKTVKAISNLSTNQTTIDVSNLTKGVYMVEITSDADLKSIKKFIIK